jgi:membrane-associated phospholipid phosphatase
VPNATFICSGASSGNVNRALLALRGIRRPRRKRPDYSGAFVTRVTALLLCVALPLSAHAAPATKESEAPAVPRPAEPVAEIERPAPPKAPIHPTPMPYDLPLDISVTAGAGILWVTLELLKPELATPCHWCDRNAQGESTLNAFDQAVRTAFKWNDTKTADALSTVFSFALAPGAGIAVGAAIAGHDHRIGELPAGLLVVAESAMLAMDVNQITKYAVGRERPDVHARTPADRAGQRAGDDNLSFFSGHATLAFALSTSAGTIASMRSYRLAPLMWVAGMTFATAGSYLRIAADRHYATDVITGMVVGAAVGFSVPYFGHRPGTRGIRFGAMPVPEGAGIMASGVF